MVLCDWLCDKTMNSEIARNHAYLNFRKEMRMLAILAVVVILAALALAVALIGVTVAYVMGKITDIGLVLGLGATVGGIVTTCIAYLAPSPLQNAAPRRSTDSAHGILPSGTPADPIATHEVALDANPSTEVAGEEGDQPND